MANLSNVADVVKAFKTAIAARRSTYNLVFASQLDYQRILEENRETKKHRGTVATTDFPILGFTRVALKRTSTFGPKSSIDLVRAPHPTIANTYNIFHHLQGELEFQFMFISNNAADIDEFEIEYLVEEGISYVKDFSLVFSALNNASWVYNLYWQDFTERTFNTQDNNYQALQGAVSIHGDFFYQQTGTAGAIQTIDMGDATRGTLDTPTGINTQMP